ncbi:MAG: type ISP restriction/modification enzyme [Nitrospirota bacterium]
MSKLFYKDLWGKREDKYKFLESNDVTTLDWQELTPAEPYYFFVPKDFSLREEYERFWSIKDVFIQFSSGVKTHRDHFIAGFTKEEVVSKIRIFTGTLDDETVKESLKLKDTRDWKLSEARAKLKEIRWKDVIIPYAYRAFDQRFICYCTDLIDRGCDRYDLMKTFFKENIGLVTTRKIPEIFGVSAFVNIDVGDIHLIGDQNYFFPLYLYQKDNSEKGLLCHSRENGNPEKTRELDSCWSLSRTQIRDRNDNILNRTSNINPEFLNAIKESLGYEPMPEEIFYYIYAVLYSPTYRKKYQEFLKIDFPRIPLPDQLILKSTQPPFSKGGITAFKSLSELGKRLINLHLLEDSEFSTLDSKLSVGYPVQGTDKVERIKYQNGRGYINKEQYFENIPEHVWNYHIGSYQVLEKFLKDRKGRRLSLDEIKRYIKIASAITKTIEIQKKIDRIGNY